VTSPSDAQKNLVIQSLQKARMEQFVDEFGTETMNGDILKSMVDCTKDNKVTNLACYSSERLIAEFDANSNFSTCVQDKYDFDAANSGYNESQWGEAWKNGVRAMFFVAQPPDIDTIDIALPNLDKESDKYKDLVSWASNKSLGYWVNDGQQEDAAAEIMNLAVAGFFTPGFDVTNGNVSKYNVPNAYYEAKKYDTKAELVEASRPKNINVFSQRDASALDRALNEINTLPKGVVAGVEFYKLDENNLKYHLRMLPKYGGFANRIESWLTDKLRLDNVPQGSGDDRGSRFYLTGGWSFFQYGIDMAHTQKYHPDRYNDAERPSLSARQIAYPAYTRNDFLAVIAGDFPLVPFIVFLSFLFPAIQITSELVMEKQLRLRESMKMMGLAPWKNLVAWYIKHVSLFSVVAVVLTIITKSQLVKETNAVLIFFVYFFFIVAIIAECFAISAAFSNAKITSLITFMVLFATYLPLFFIVNDETWIIIGQGGKFFFALFPPTAMGMAFKTMSKYESYGTGVQWSNLADGPSMVDDWSLGDTYGMLVLSTFMYMFLAWYLEQVIPQDYGVRRPPWFLCLPSYWRDAMETKEEPTDVEKLTDAVSPTEFEAVEEDLVPSIQIKNLTKTFGSKIAVNNMNLTMYEGQITALLGHNGAGKTTTISMLTGLFAPSGGDAVINGSSITTDIDGVRSSLGICPQFDVVWATLTVAEHLRFYCHLKNVPEEQVEAQVNEMVADIGLEDKRHSQSKDLSGGMRRRLSVGIALIGGSKIVILDEPTSGQDPAARRGTWDLLLKQKKNRTIVLTTHFMDEADLLGDRIAIMTSGQARCCGSSLFLKSRYGKGYRLTMSKASESGEVNVNAVTKFIQSHVPEAALSTNVGSELSFVLPTSGSGEFEGLFDNLDKSLTTLGLQDYGLALTTMEEVFLKVGADSEDLTEADDHSAELTPNQQLLMENIKEAGEYELDEIGLSLRWRHFVTLFMKRVLNARRDWFILILQLLFPIVFLSFAMITARFNDPLPDVVPLTLSPTTYGESILLAEDETESPQAPLDEVKTTLVTHFDPLAVTVLSSSNGLWADVTKNNVGLQNQFNVYSQRSQESEPGLKVSRSMGFVLDDAVRNGTPVPDLQLQYNPLMFHIIPVGISAMTSNVANFKNNGTKVSIEATNTPFPKSAEGVINSISNSFVSFALSTLLLWGLAVLSASFAFFLVNEKQTGAKHQQMTSGVSFSGFWLATYAWDALNSLLCSAFLLIVFWGGGVDEYNTGGNLFHCFMQMFLYCTANMWIVYVFAIIISRKRGVTGTGAFGLLFLLNFFLTGLIPLLLIFVLSIPSIGAQDVGDALADVFLFLPSYALASSLQNLYTNTQLNDNCVGDASVVAACAGAGLVPQPITGFTQPGIGASYLAQSLHSIFGIGIVIFVEWLLTTPYFAGSRVEGTRAKPAPSMDEDVAAEARRVNSPDYDTSSDILVLRELTKWYSASQPRPSVDHLSVGIPKGQCFGLLGINGAGKTTTFKMLTGDHVASSGDAFVGGKSVTKELNAVRQQIGYCPQFDGLVDNLTGRETLRMYAILRGVPKELVEAVVEENIIKFDLQKHCDNRCGAYSGGNKRKLSTAMAMIGNPKTLFLDEPSTGMDPGARRFIWNTISSALREETDRSVVLTSHSMEECEALCTRIAIMVNGRFKCLGSLQHLKSRFGGYISLMMVTRDAASAPAARKWVEDTFPGSVLKDSHSTFLEFNVDPGFSWGQLFGRVESNREALNLIDYGINQPSLEQIFLGFAKEQDLEDTNGKKLKVNSISPEDSDDQDDHHDQDVQDGQSVQVVPETVEV